MQYIGIDLGSTNIKAAVYDENFSCLAEESHPMEYLCSGGFVEFDPEAFFDGLVSILQKLLKKPEIDRNRLRSIGLTGQAETLVVLGEDGRPLMNAISWMDERSKEECVEIEARFSKEEYQGITGQQAVLPTWPATKILWIQRHRSEVFERATCYMLLKDYVVYRLTGKKISDCSVATFSFYFDIYRKCYWKEMLEVIGLREEQLPLVAEPCTDMGRLKEEICVKTGLPPSVSVNIGTLDHFAGMVGTGNIEPGGISLSTGTVMALAVQALDVSRAAGSGIAMHYGFLPDTYIMLPVAESGGVSLEWFRKTCMPGADYKSLNEELLKRKLPNGLIFLPYLTGTNAPEFDEAACGLFYGLRARCDVYDMAAAVMEGVAFVLRKNCDLIQASGTEIQYIIATGGGAKSSVWCQMQADITGVPVVIPREKEAACLGAAVIGAVGAGAYASYHEAAALANGIVMRYEPKNSKNYEKKYEKFCALYRAMLDVTEL